MVDVLKIFLPNEESLLVGFAELPFWKKSFFG